MGTRNIEKKENKDKTGGLLANLKSNIERNNERETNRRRVIRNSRAELEGLRSRTEYEQAKGKLAKFMSTEGMHYSQNESNENLLDGYHFETVKRGVNIQPQPEIVVKEVKTLNNRFQEIIDSYLKADPAKIKELQVKLNDWINSGMVIKDKNAPTGQRTINPIDAKLLKKILEGTGMELTDNGANVKRRYTIREDGMFGPQTFAVLCCFKKEFRKTTTTHTNRGTREKIA